MSRYRLSLAAQADLDEIWLYIATQASMETADTLIDSITNRFPVIASMPRIGRSAEIDVKDVRVLPVESYLVYYRSTPKGVQILRVIHGMRDQRSALNAE